jgi:hypothetical protein
MGWVVARGVSVAEDGHVLAYGLGIGGGVLGAAGLLVTGYLVACLGAPLLSPDGFVRGFGVAAAVGAAGCVAAWRLAFASTWCAFAALLSVLLLVWVRRGPAPGAGGGAGSGAVAQAGGGVQAG